MNDPLEHTVETPGVETRPRQRFELEDTGFDEVPPRFRKFYRRWRGPGDTLGPNEVICPVCKVVIRSTRELRPGDRVYCMPCMSRLVIVRGEDGRLEARVAY
ncbi:MAG: hypothetical protein KatS3mg077_0641 [Candidatus Binatia bacterium]|nr:MAG: hypothetical protein KatS3mg077_0641 [Candidatus Binatia bacterium]